MPFTWFRRGNITTLEILTLALLIPLFGFATEPIYDLIPSIEWLDKLFYDELRRLIQPHIFSFISVAILPAILEEALMRGIILDGLLKRYKPWKAILISAFLFGLMHLNPMQFVAGLLTGLLLGWVYWKTKSLLACMVMHATNNGLSFFLTLHFGFDTKTDQLVGGMKYVIIVFVSALLFIYGVARISKRWTNRNLS